MSSNSDLLTSLNEMYGAANRRAEAAEWRDNYATGYSDGIWDARNKVLLSPNWQKAYEKERALCTSVLDQYRGLEDEMDGLIHLTNKIRDIVDEALMDDMESPDAAVEALTEIIRLLDGGDA